MELAVQLRELLDKLTDAKQAYVSAKKEAEDALLAADYAVQRRSEAGQRIGRLNAQIEKLREQL